MEWELCVVLLALFSVRVSALFEDQVGNYDW